MSPRHQLARTADKPNMVRVVVSCRFFVTWQVVQWVPLTLCSHHQSLPGWIMEFLEVDDLGSKGYQNELRPLEDLLEVATSMGLVGQHSGLAWN